MRAKFAGGPYDLCHFEISGSPEHLRLPVQVMAPKRMDSRTWEGHALYKFRHGNDEERVYYFDRLEI